MTERDIQIALWYFCERTLRHSLISPNTHFYDWESDVLSVTRTGFVHEWEIKVSRSDFKADREKHRHAVLTKSYSLRVVAQPNYFWYVTPPGLVNIDEVPDHAGLAYIDIRKPTFHQIVVQRRAPKIYDGKVSDADKVRLMRSMMFRFWRMRQGSGTTESTILT